MRAVAIAARLVAACTRPGSTYHADVAPLLARHCLGCHAQGGIAFPLATYAEVEPLAPLIAQSTAARIMPPWLVDNGGGCQTYRDAKWLTEKEIATIDAWASGGRPEGSAPASPERPVPEHLDDTALVLDPGVAYTPDASEPDDYRCFVIDPGLDDDTFFGAYEVVPGDAQTVHHVIVFALDTDRAETQAEALDAASEAPGYPCFGGAGVSDTRVLVGWAPGGGVTRFPDGVGLALRARRRVVMQVHYNVLAGSRPDRTRVRLALERPQKEGFAFLLADPSMSLPPGRPDAAHEFQLSPRQLGVPLGLFLRGVFPHMHRSGVSMRVELRGETGAQCVTDVRRWNFSWQQFYFFEEPLYVYANDTLSIRCVYDTRGRDEPVTWGEGTEDEMCLLGLFFTAF